MGKINVLKLTTGLLLMTFQGCLEYPADLKVTIKNNTQSDILVDEYTCCDSSVIEQNVRWFCHMQLDTSSYPRIIKKGQRAIMNTRMKASESIMVINADSMRVYCQSIQKVRYKHWVQIISRDVDKEQKLCDIQVNDPTR